jgi:hypothetical protein
MVKGKVRYHRTYLKLHSEWEAYAYPLVKEALDAQIKPVIAWLTEDNFDALPAYVDYLLSTVPMREALQPIYETVGVSAARFSYAWIQDSVRKDLTFFSENWLKQIVDWFLLNAGTKIAGITETTIERIKQVISDSAQLNLSRREQAKYIEETLSDPDFNRKRALVIARTESTTAANYGVNLGAEASDYVVEKIWVATLDKRTRYTHKIAGMSPGIPANAMFNVGGTLMLYPGDPTAPADETVNCRCVILNQAVTDADGLPMLKPRAVYA